MKIKIVKANSESRTTGMADLDNGYGWVGSKFDIHLHYWKLLYFFEMTLLTSKKYGGAIVCFRIKFTVNTLGWIVHTRSSTFIESKCNFEYFFWRIGLIFMWSFLPFGLMKWICHSSGVFCLSHERPLINTLVLQDTLNACDVSYEQFS